MKKILIFVCIMFCGMFAFSANAQTACNSELYNNMALKMLTPGYTFVKSYRIDGKGGERKKIEYTCVFSKDTNYMIRMASKDGNQQGLIVTLFDSKREQLISSYLNDTFFPGWQYKCSATGIYYLSFTFKDSKSYCGAAVLGFRR
ncbi:MAG: hypothetical protein EAZ57_06390 [Cytophagales bacterium]|nr:MAG: hypothetical protein EAZ67_07435 [Cytophagales bacterium]TAF60654.1 MAG: hypothetical protein EAZ57_06390 [Cytophagales bacterium]